MKKLCLIFLTVFGVFNAFSNEVKPKLHDYKYNVYSQYGEDGIIKKIFEEIGVQSKVCIEFGAWDGFYLSNTANLWANDNWKGILIESDKPKYDLLKENIKMFNCIPIHHAVGKDEFDSLEWVLSKHDIKDQIDLLSIDIDGNDYHIFKSLMHLRPRVIVCEYNPTMPSHIDMYGEYNNNIGCSVSALVRVAKEKKYSLAAITYCNCFFVRDDEFEKLNKYETRLEMIQLTNSLRFVVTDYEGRPIVISENPHTTYGISNNNFIEKVNGSFFIHEVNVKKK